MPRLSWPREASFCRIFRSVSKGSVIWGIITSPPPPPPPPAQYVRRGPA
jgi:hypothetical protein